MSGDVRSVKNALSRVHREIRNTRSKNLTDMWRLLQASLYLGQGNHSRLQAVAYSLIKNNRNGFGYLYLAHSQYLLGIYAACQRSLQAFFKYQPHHPDGVYLAAEAFVLLGQREQAWHVLEQLSRQSTRLKTWLAMAHLVQDHEDYRRLHANWLQAKKWGTAPGFHINVSEYIAQGALRAKLYGEARQIWRDIICTVLENPAHYARGQPSINGYGVRPAAHALRDLHHLFKLADIPMFLVSGTLLGCIREGQLLGHDKDVDVGIWEDISLSHLLNTLRASGLFYIQVSRAPELVRVKHVNGIAIDIFYHYREAGTYWHGGVKVRWHNTPFELTTHNFLGEDYLIPNDSDKYLTENYGDWRTPKRQFDSVYDTPNMEVINMHELAVHNFRGLLKGILTADTAVVDSYQNRLAGLGESGLVVSYKD